MKDQRSHANRVLHPSSQSPSTEKRDEDKSPRNSISLTYSARIAVSHRSITITWTKCLTNHSLIIALDNFSVDQNAYTCKIDLKSFQFWGKKGLKSLDIDGRRVEVYWDLRQAKFSSSPQPDSDYYIAVVSEGEVALLLGDLKNEALKRTRKLLSSSEACLLYKKEDVCSKRVFHTKAILDESKREHDVIIESALSGPDDPEMWINIDGIVVVRIMNLNWRFRGNEAVMVNDDRAVEIYWDVHDWLFDGSGSSCGLFIFKPVGSESGADEKMSDSEYRHVLHAWKTE